MKIITISQIKGGCGKTTDTIELATVFHNMGKRVLVIDLDENSSVGKLVNANLIDYKEKTIRELLLNNEVDYNKNKQLFDSCVQHLPMFDLVIGLKSLEKAEIDFSEPDDVFRLLDYLKDVLEPMDLYDYVFIDNRAATGKLPSMTYAAVDYIVIPTDESLTSLTDVDDTERDINALKKSRMGLCHAQVIGYIISNSSNTGLGATVSDIIYGRADQDAGVEPAMQDLKDAEGNMKKFVGRISHAVSVQNAGYEFTTVSYKSKSSKVARQCYSIAEAMIKRMEV